MLIKNEVEKTVHKCKMPSSYNSGYSDKNFTVYAGDIYQCDECGNWFRCEVADDPYGNGGSWAQISEAKAQKYINQIKDKRMKKKLENEKLAQKIETHKKTLELGSG